MSLFDLAVTIAAPPKIAPEVRDNFILLYRYGAMTDDRLVEKYQLNAHLFGWGELTRAEILQYRRQFANELCMVAVLGPRAKPGDPILWTWRW